MYPFLKKYFIREGFSFVDQHEVKRGGDTITLSDDVAAQHAHKLELMVEADLAPEPEPALEPAPAPEPDALETPLAIPAAQA